MTDGKRSILYVEDSPANLALMEQYFDIFDGIELLMAATAEEGLAVAREQKPALILMDIHLPGMSGIEAFSRLRAMDETRQIPVIAISADAMPDDVQRALDMGFEAYLVKPIKLKELEDLVFGLLEAEK